MEMEIDKTVSVIFDKFEYFHRQHKVAVASKTQDIKMLVIRARKSVIRDDVKPTIKELSLKVMSKESNEIRSNDNDIKKEHRIKRKDNSSFSQWHNLATDLLILVINKLNYEDCIYLRAVCKGWRVIQKSTCATILDIPLQGIAAILIILGKDSFKDFFSFFICWIKGQNDRTIKALLDLTPIQELYHWGY
ncbi:uncharacterized protein LOC108198351 isoform X1 [Daucus carota subsp. sativus]|uniref:uncharacterized protein LOC108198351 isoform X1 n=1 Tax=Daucus carota subsp. sativus TaxID=79200 RepID=UPI003082838F